MEIKELSAPALIVGLKVSAVIGVQANDRPTLLEYLKGLCSQFGLKVPHLAGGPLLTIKLPCGSEARYDTEGDIPDVSVPCPCGNPTHWLIKYVPRE